MCATSSRAQTPRVGDTVTIMAAIIISASTRAPDRKIAKSIRDLRGYSSALGLHGGAKNRRAAHLRDFPGMRFSIGGQRLWDLAFSFC
jgi:hypothetical protein